ncbi:MAG: hypothetical protein ABIS07_08935 [Dokdonella sp.]
MRANACTTWNARSARAAHGLLALKRDAFIAVPWVRVDLVGFSAVS